MNLYDNASPRINLRGIDDQSGRTVAVAPVERPQHLPYVPIFAKKGKPGLQFLSPNHAAIIYGDESFVENGKYATHVTPLYNVFAKNANTMAIERLFAPGTAMASFRLSVDVLGPIPIEQFQRGEDGQFVLDQDGNKIPTGATRSGYRVKFVKSEVTLDNDGQSTYGKMSERIGNQVYTDGAETVQSKLYPFLDLLPPDAGQDGNNRGFSIWAATELDVQTPDTALLTDPKAQVFPIRLAQWYRSDEYSTGKNVRTTWNEDSVELSLKSKTYNSRVEQNISLDKDWIRRYTNPPVTGQPPVFGQFESIHVYSTFIEKILKDALAAEMAADEFFNDELIGNADKPYLFNMISGRNISGANYQTFEIDTQASDAILLAKESYHYLMGGADGEMTQDTYENAAVEAIAKWYDPNHEYAEVLKYPVRVLYDTGYKLENKYKLVPFMGLRKDLILGLTTHTVGEPKLTGAQESSRALALQTRCRLFPESTFHGTSTCRAFIIGRHGTKIDSLYDGELPLILEVADWFSQMMGAGNGRWKADKVPDRHPNNMIKTFTDINCTFVPGSAQAVDWNNGLNWVAAWDMNGSVYMPSLQTVYPDDTSILNSVFAAFACAEVEYLGCRIHATFSGSVTLTDSEFREEVTKEYNRLLDRKFANLFNTSVDTTIDGLDALLGYSWYNQVQVAGDPAKTVMTLDVQTVRRSAQTAA